MIRVKIDDTIKAYFRQGVKLFYDTGKTRTLKETFEQTVVYFFHQGWELRNGVMAPILPPAEELPTLGQFRYWYGKERGLAKKITSRVFGPGSEWQIDVTVGDVYPVSG